MADKVVLAEMQDLMALDCIPGLIKAGVSCLKIEGRLKGPEYVAVTTQAYRQAVDAAWDQVMQQASGLHASSEGPSQLVTEQQRKALHQVCRACRWSHRKFVLRLGSYIDLLHRIPHSLFPCEARLGDALCR